MGYGWRVVDKIRAPIQTLPMHRPIHRQWLLVCLGLLTAFPISTALAGPGQGLAPNEVKNALRPYMQAMHDCTSRQHELDASVSGKLEFSFTIGNRGHVTRVELLSETHAGSYAAGCIDGVLRAVAFPKFKGKPVVVPKFPVSLAAAAGVANPMEDDELSTPTRIRKAPRKLRAKVARRLKRATGKLRACVADLRPKPQKKARRRRARVRRVGPLKISFVLNQFGRTSDVNVQDKAHAKDYVAGCVTGVLFFTEFPMQGSDKLSFSNVRLPRL